MPGDLYSIPVQAATGVSHLHNTLSSWLPGITLPSLSLHNYLPDLDFSRIASISRYQAYSSDQLSSVQDVIGSDADYVSAFVKGKRLNLCESDRDTKGVVFAASYTY